MSVVLRCPTCGTTQGHDGECEACAAGNVRYFCTNHDEGIWLDGPTCSRCGAEFGKAAARPAAVPTRRMPRPPSHAPDFRPPSGRTPERAPDVDFGSPPRRPYEPEAPAEPAALPPSLGELIEEITERARAERHDVREEVVWEEPRTRGFGFPLGGCLFRMVGLAFLLFVALVLFLFVLLSGSIMG